MSTLTIDFDKVQEAVETLKGNPPSEDEIMNDPKGFLAKYGVVIDDDMHDMIKTKLYAAKSAQALIVHVDAG